MEHRNELFDALMNGLPPSDQTDVRKAITSTTVQKAEHISAATARDAERIDRRRALRRAQQSAAEDG